MSEGGKMRGTKKVQKIPRNEFKANEFIKELENDVGREKDFSSYILAEKNLLLRAKQDLDERTSQASTLRGLQSSKKTLRASSTAGRVREHNKYGKFKYNSIGSVNETMIPNKP
eukprot:TRINITY_DN18756_c0_g1_i7.p1 TRINITY_DN18756_c0_g1~~TRINITY_DN18756_c0_g1_i7.p1  ORF type:complete len:114 (+),score=21.40 TRINITY_DN18756_c0_g1_i7:142-483(+)